MGICFTPATLLSDDTGYAWEQGGLTLMLLTDEIIIWKKIEKLNWLVLFFSSVELVKNYRVEVNILIDWSKEI